MLFQKNPRFFRKGQSVTTMSVNLDILIPDHFFRVFALFIKFFFSEEESGGTILTLYGRLKSSALF